MPSFIPRERIAALSRRSALRSLGAGTVGLLAALGQRQASGSGQITTHAMPARREAITAPNILLIVTDDLDARALAFMPNVTELLGAQGTSFANYFATTPLCTPARATILRGQYAHNHGVLGNAGKNGGFHTFFRLGREATTVGTCLQDAGYRTALIGKYLNGYPDANDMTYVPPGWDDWFVGVNDSGKYFNYTINDNGTLIDFGEGEANYSTNVFAAQATDFMRATASEQPFFLLVATHAPHGPAKAPERYLEAFRDVAAPRSPSFNEADISDKSGWLRELRELTDEQIAEIDTAYRNRLASLVAVDALLATVIAELEARGDLDATYIFFTTDQGYHLGEHRITSGKRTPYEETIHIPLLVRGPGMLSGRVEERMALDTDLAPTIVDLAGAAVPDFFDGRSLVPLLSGEVTATWRQAALIEGFSGPAAERVARRNSREARGLKATPPATPEEAEADEEQDLSAIPEFFAIRTGDDLYVEYEGGDIEWYDLYADPYQLTNLAATGDSEKLSLLARWLGVLRTCSALSCRSAENGPPLAPEPS